MQEQDVQLIPLSQLEASVDNVRKAPAGAAALAELKASITAHGLLQNLVVRPLGRNSKGGERYGVVAGARRLSALHQLVCDGVLKSSFQVRCGVLDDSDQVQEVSLAENEVRVAMHPADQVTTFASLVEAGSKVSEIAARFGISKRTVEQRLRLGTVAPEILDAYREGTIDLECVKAFTVTTDQQRQLHAWQQAQQQGNYGSPPVWMIKRLLTDNQVPAKSALAKFVGRKAYKAAGGTITEDLFAGQYEDGTWFDNPEILHRLATAKLKTVADKLVSTWKWVESHLEVDWGTRLQFGRVSPTRGEPTAAEQAEMTQLEQRLDELNEMADADDESSASRSQEGTTIENRLNELERLTRDRDTFSDPQRAVAGCIVTIGEDNKAEVLQGFVRREDAAEAAKLQDAGNRVVGAAATTSVDPSAKARKKVGVGLGLADDLRAIRNNLIKSRLAGNFALALDLVVFQFARVVFERGYHTTALDIDVCETPNSPYAGDGDERFGTVNIGEKYLEADRELLPLAWLAVKRPGEAFANMRALSQSSKERLFAACVARTLKGQLGWEPQACPQVEAVVAALGIDFAAEFRPPADLYWQRITKGTILEVARNTVAKKVVISLTRMTNRPAQPTAATLAAWLSLRTVATHYWAAAVHPVNQRLHRHAADSLRPRTEGAIGQQRHTTRAYLRRAARPAPGQRGRLWAPSPAFQGHAGQ